MTSQSKGQGMGVWEVGGAMALMVLWFGGLLILGIVIYHAVKGAVRSAARDATDEVIVRLMDYGWRPPMDRLPPEAAEIRRQEVQRREGREGRRP